jgi:hypothetical protein
MADQLTQFSCLFDVGSAENAAQAEEVRGTFTAELYRQEGGYPGFEMQVEHDIGPGSLWIHGDEYGEPEHVIRFVLRCAERLSLEGVWGFTWSHSCSSARVDAFGAHVIDLVARRTIADIDCARFGSERISAAAGADEPGSTAR